ncbi:tudor domain-containing protein 7-like [Teleopsis dalmanni]|uniref:tudor domain-containing protein 7-like n=1 Tax=Teleopsis dalmanni TaxID=139649 RepID=UPI0018CEC00C|nr:tudor domain-containing protein 7-like [Teleopsis dalmanni]
MSLRTESDKKTLSNSDKAEQLSAVVSVVRALIASKKPPYKLRDILKEYPQVEGGPLPFIALGYKAPEDLLKDTNEFVITRIDNELCLASKGGGKCQHISDFVINQKVSKSKRLVAASPIENQRKPRESAKNWNKSKSSYSSNLFQRFTTPQNKLFQPYRKNKEGDRNNNWRTGQKVQLHSGPSPNLSGQFKGSTKPLAVKKVSKDEKNAIFSKRLESDKMDDMYKSAKYGLQKPKTVDNSQSPDMRDKLISNRYQQVDAAYPRAILGQQKQGNGFKMGVQGSNRVVTQSQNNMDRQQNDNKQVLRFGSDREAQQQLYMKTEITFQELRKLQHKQNQNVQQAPQHRQNGCGNFFTSSIQNRLKISAPQNTVQTTIDTHNVQNKPNNLKHSLPSPENSGQSIAAIKRAALRVLNEKNPLESLFEYCALCNYESPQYSVSKSKFEKNYQCRVTINGFIYFTYPTDYPTEMLAKIGCAIKAIEQIKAAEYRRPMRPCTITDYEFIERLHADLSLHPHGMFSNKISEFYELKYKETPPEHWWSLVTVNVNKFLIEKIQSETVIVFAKDDTTNEEITPPLKEEEGNKEMEGIKLPWGTKHWELYITYVVSPIEVWCRLFGEDYDKQFIKMIKEIRITMAKHRAQIATTVTTNHIYLAYDNQEEWHRVRVMEVNKTAKTATVFYIDYGDTENLPLTVLHECEPRFLQLPAQAITFTLFGLEDLYGNPFVIQPLKKHMPVNKSVVGEVITNEESFNSDTSAGGKIQVAVFDTSSNIDINLNELIMNEVCLNSPLPSLIINTVVNVIISHVTTDGVVHFRRKGPESNYVEKLMYQLVDSKLVIDGTNNVSIDDVKSGKLILVCDKSDYEINWYRGKLADSDDVNLRVVDVPDNNKQKSDKEFDIVYVDHGFIKRIHISDMYPLDTLSSALYNFPQQRLKARLRKIPAISKEVVALMHNLLPDYCDAMLKMIGYDGDMPLVKAYRRIPPHPHLVSINHTLRGEHELGKFIVSDYNDYSFFQDGTNPQPRSPTTNNFKNMKPDTTTTTIPTSSKLYLDDLPLIEDYKNMPKKGEYLNVVGYVCGSPANFMVQPYDDRKLLKNLMAELTVYCKSTDDFVPFNKIKIGQAYAAKNEEGVYSRVIVKDIISSDIIHIFFCDFGDTMTVNNEKLKFLPAKFRKLPKLALHSRIWNIEPKDGEYTYDDCITFRKLTVGKKFAASVKKIEYDQNGIPGPFFHLDLVDTSSAVDLLVRDFLCFNCNVVSGNMVEE